MAAGAPSGRRAAFRFPVAPRSGTCREHPSRAARIGRPVLSAHPWPIPAVASAARRFGGAAGAALAVASGSGQVVALEAIAVTDGDHHKELALRLEQAPYGAALGLRSQVCAPGDVRVLLPWSDAHANAMGFVHGGAMASLLVAGLGLAAWSSQYEDAVEPGPVPADGLGRPLGVSILFGRMSRGQDVACDASVVHRGRELIQLEAVARAGGAVVARALATHRIGPAQGPADARPMHRSARRPRDEEHTGRLHGLSAFTRSLGAYVVERGPGHAAMEVGVSGKHDAAGAFDLGAIAAVCDTCAALACRYVLGSAPTRVATLSMVLDSVMALVEDAVVTADVVARRDDIFDCRLEISGAESGLLAATATVKYRFS